MTISFNKNDNNLYANNNSGNTVSESNSDNRTPGTEVKPVEVFSAKTPERIKVQTNEKKRWFYSRIRSLYRTI